MIFRGEDVGDYEIEAIDENHVVLVGGGDFYDGVGAPDVDTSKRAEALAARFGMVITKRYGEFWGYSEWTPEPGDVSIFMWQLLVR